MAYGKILLSLSRLADYSYFSDCTSRICPFRFLTYVVAIGVLGFANYMKMSYRQEPIYPDDLKMITEIGLLKDMTGTMLFTVILAAAGTVIGLFCWYMFRSLKKEGDSN